MEKSVTQFRQLADWAPLSIAMFDLDMRYLDLSQGWRNDCQIGDRNVIGMSHYDLFPDLPERWKEVHRRCFAGNTERCESDLFLRPDGSKACIRWEVKPWRNDSGNIAGIVMWTEDITAQKMAEIEVQNSERRFKTALGNSPISVWEQDLQLRYTWFYNPKLGYALNEVIGKTDAQLMDPAYAKEITILKRRVIETGESIRQEVTAAAPDAPLGFFDLSIEPLRDLSGQVVGITCSAIDITEQKQVSQALSDANQELARSNADLQQFAYAASHDLQEPLRSVSSCVQLLKKRYAGQIDARADEFIEHAMSGAARMQQLINDLLLYARLSADSQDKVPVQLNDALNLALANLSSAIAQTQAEITFDNLPEVWGYKGQMPQLFQNLVGNALKFKADRAPVIHIGVIQAPQEWVIAVKDNGIGIEPQYVDRVFQLFQRLHTREEFSGTGIGLALCQKILERHGGRIWLESEPGHGSTFFFSLPRMN